MTSRGGPYHSYKPKTACNLYVRKNKKRYTYAEGSQMRHDLNMARPNAHLETMRRDYIRATAALIREHGWNCYGPFNLKVGKHG